MAARTTDELLRELDRTPGGPVELEDPRNGAKYVLISHEAYCRIRPFLNLPQPRDDSPVDWTDRKDVRRLALIERDITGELSPEEKEQLERLQDEFYRYREQIAPLPSPAILELIKEALERRGAEQPPAAAS